MTSYTETTSELAVSENEAAGAVALERSLYSLLAEGIEPTALRTVLAVLNEQAPSPDDESGRGGEWSETHLRRLLLVTADHRLAAAWRLLLIQGLTIGEVCSLEWSQVHLADRRLMFRGVPEKGRENLGQAEVIHLDRGTLNALSRLRRWRSEARAGAAGQWVRGNRVFVHPNGVALTASDFEDSLRQVTEERGLPPVTVADLVELRAEYADGWA